MASIRGQLQSELRLKLLRYLSEHPDASTRQIAEALGVSNGQSYYLLKALVDKGLVEANILNSKGKLQHLHPLTGSGFIERVQLTQVFLEIKRQEYLALRAEIDALEEDLRRDDAYWQKCG